MFRFVTRKRESWVYVSTNNLTMVLFCFESKSIDLLLSNVVIALHLLNLHFIGLKCCSLAFCIT